MKSLHQHHKLFTAVAQQFGAQFSSFNPRAGSKDGRCELQRENHPTSASHPGEEEGRARGWTCVLNKLVCHAT